MTKIEIIEKKIEKDQITLKKLRDKEHEIEKARIEKWTEMYSRYFKDAIMEGDTLEVSDSYVYFKRFKEDYNYHKEIISLNVRAKSWRDMEADSIETSFYSTNDNSDYELKRMITIGRVGMVVLDFKDDIIAEYNSIRSSFKDKLSKARAAVSSLNHEISKLSTEISRIRDQEVLDRLSNDGVEFEVDEENLYKLPSLSVRWNWEIRYIKKVKVLSETKSGKSVDIELETCINQYDYEKQDNVFSTNVRKFERVRRDKVDSLVTWNREKVIS